MNEHNHDLLNQFIRYHNLLLRFHHRTCRERGGFVDTMRGQGRVLSILKMKPEITQKELAYLLDMRVQSLSELLSKLEGKGYISRTPSQEDRRVMVVRLTQEGAAAVEEAGAGDEESPFRCLSEEECGVLSGYMDRLIAAMEEELGAGTDECRGPGNIRDMWRQMAGFGAGFDNRNPPPHHPHHGGQRGRHGGWEDWRKGPDNGADEED